MSVADDEVEIGIVADVESGFSFRQPEARRVRLLPILTTIRSYHPANPDISVMTVLSIEIVLLLRLCIAQ